VGVTQVGIVNETKKNFKTKSDTTTLYIANRAFIGLPKFRAINKQRQIVDLVRQEHNFKGAHELTFGF